MPKLRILVVDDEPGMLEVCAEALHELPSTEVIVENRSDRAAERLALQGADFLITDIRMPGLSGIDLLRLVRQQEPYIPVLMLTGYPTVETAVESLRLGAAEYLTKPFRPADFLAIVKQLLDARPPRDMHTSSRRDMGDSPAAGRMLGRSAVIRTVLEQIDTVAAVDVDVLIEGETGTGKELVARALHQRSRRRDHPFVAVNCAAVPDELMESEFFGHERGAFTGAQARGLGLLEAANRGTFFLDELSQLPLRLQPKLLRVLQERSLRRVGGMQEIPLDVRIVAASLLDLEQEMRAGRFRQDLYYRLSVIRIQLPPLRERPEDIPLLARYFLDRFAGELGKGTVALNPEAMERLASFAWPGNVRQLQNVLKRALVMTRGGVIGLDDLPDEIVACAGETRTRDATDYFCQREERLAAFEKEFLRNLLARCNGSIADAVREAHLPRATLYRLLKKHDFNPRDFRC